MEGGGYFDDTLHNKEIDNSWSYRFLMKIIFVLKKLSIMFFLDLSVGLVEMMDKNQDQKNVYPDFNKHWELLRPETSIRWLGGDLLANGGDIEKIKLHIESQPELAKAEEMRKHASERYLPSSESYLPASLVTRVHLFNVLTSAAIIKTASEELKKTQL